MSADIFKELQNSKKFQPESISMSFSSNPETIRKVHTDLEKRLGPKKIKSQPQFDLSEIKQVAEIVDELFDKRLKMTSSESRVAPASAINLPKRQQLYEQNPTLPRIASGASLAQRNGSIQSEDHLRGIYTLPSSDPENPSVQNAVNDLSSKTKSSFPDNPYFNGKFVANVLATIQLALILLFAIFIHYDQENVTAISRSYIESQKPTERPNYDNNFYKPNHNNNNNYDRNNYNSEEGRYGSGPQNLPVTTAPPELGQNLHQFYYCK